MEENKHLEVDLRSFEQDWRKEIAEKEKIDKEVDEIGNMEIKQREKEGDKEGLEQLSTYWLKFNRSNRR